MKSLADALPADIARQIHPDWHKNESACWAVRAQLLCEQKGQWIAFAAGAVIVAAFTPLEVFLAIKQSGRHPYFIRVGHEDEPWHRIRRASFAYDTTYPSEALPVLSAEFRAVSGTTGIQMDCVIPDTGADTTTTTLVGLSTFAPRSSPRRDRYDWSSRRRHGRDDWISDLGLARRPRISVSTPSRFRRPRANPVLRLMRFLIDTSVLGRLANQFDPGYPVTVQALTELHRRNETVFLTAKNLIEFRNFAIRPTKYNGLGLTLADADQKAALFESSFSFLKENSAIFPAWKTLIQASAVIGKQVHDARLVAVCHVNGISYLLTFNVTHFARLAAVPPGIVVVDPATV